MKKLVNYKMVDVIFIMMDLKARGYILNYKFGTRCEVMWQHCSSNAYSTTRSNSWGNLAKKVVKEVKECTDYICG